MEAFFYLNNLVELANRSNKAFSITKNDGPSFCICIAVGEHKYFVETFTLEALMSANVAIMASIRLQEGW